MKKVGVMVLLMKQGKVLFLVRKKENDDLHKQGVYLPIGGKVERGEGLEACAIREVREESGVSINRLKLRAVLYNRFEIGDAMEDWINYLFFSDDFSGEPVDGNEGTFEWVDSNKMGDIRMYDGERAFLEAAFKYEFHVMESNHRGYDLIDKKILVSY